MAAGEKRFAPACERNREPILAVLRDAFAARRHVLEIGSGTGQHAVHFAAAMPWLTWQASDRGDALAGIRAWLDEACLSNTPIPIALELGAGMPSMALPRSSAVDGRFDALFSANTLHIVDWSKVEAFFALLPDVLAPDATVVVYGPFNDNGGFTSDSNRDFDAWLKARDPASGIRGLEAVDALAQRAGLSLHDDIAMPANNRCLVWHRAAG